MNVLFVTHRYPPRSGGVETHVQKLASRLVTRGYKVTVFSADAERGVPSRSVDDGVRVHRFRSLAPGDAFHVAPQMALAVRRADADIVHAHNYHSLPFFAAAVGVTDERFVVTPHYHGRSASTVRDRLLSVYRLFGEWSLKRADAVIAVSDWECDRLRTDFGIDATVVPNGVDIELFAEADPETRKRPYLLCVGRLEEYKGVQHVIRALPELPEFDLLVAGKGPCRTELERISRVEGVEDRIEFLGYVDDERLPRLYAGADAYLTLSEFEAYGLTVGEALAAGTPCVVREAGALTEWIHHDGCIGVSTVSPNTIAGATRECLEIGKQPNTSLSTWTDVTEQVIEMYEPDAEKSKPTNTRT